MRQIVHLIIIYAALLTLAGCGDGKSVRQLPHLGDTPYQQSARAEDGEGDFHYTISGNTVTVTIDKTGEKWTMTYADGKLSDPERIAFQKATTAQQTLVEQLYGEWQKANSALKDDDTTVKTDVTDSYTDEPARVRRR